MTEDKSAQIESHAKRLAEIYNRYHSQQGMKAEDQSHLVESITFLATTMIIDFHRIASSLERLSTPTLAIEQAD